MIRLTMFPARDGDCLMLEYGTSELRTRILIDGGRAGTYADIRTTLSERMGDGALDLLVVTHIDQDHILGVLKFFKDAERVAVNDVWFNGFDHLFDRPFETFAPKDGELLTSALLAQQVNWNAAFGNRPVEIDRGAKFVGPATLRVMAPDRSRLEALVPKWTDEVAEHGLLPGQAPHEPPPPTGFESFGPPDVDEIDALATTAFDDDPSPSNRASIAFIFEFDGVRILFTGDADDDGLVDSITPLAEAEGGRYRLDALKVSHHGSERNLSKDFLDLIDCPMYLISTNGARHRHPDPVAIARILKFGGQQKELVFNYTDRALRWDAASLREAYQYSVARPPGVDGLQTVTWPR